MPSSGGALELFTQTSAVEREEGLLSITPSGDGRKERQRLVRSARWLAESGTKLLLRLFCQIPCASFNSVLSHSSDRAREDRIAKECVRFNCHTSHSAPLRSACKPCRDALKSRTPETQNRHTGESSRHLSEASYSGLTQHHLVRRAIGCEHL